MELLAQLSWFDLVIILVLAAAVFVGFTQGMIRYALNARGGGGRVRARLAAQGPDRRPARLLERVHAAKVGSCSIFVAPLLRLRDRRLLRHPRASTAARGCRSCDSSTSSAGRSSGCCSWPWSSRFQLVVYDSVLPRVPARPAAGLPAYYDALNDSVIVEFFRETVIPTAGLPGPSVRPGRDRPPSFRRDAGRRPTSPPALDRTWFDRPAARRSRAICSARGWSTTAEGPVGGRIVEVEAYAARRTSRRTRLAAGRRGTR